MMITAEQIVAEAMELPSQMRAFVAEKLIESLDLEPEEELSPEWNAELDRRCREVDDGTVELIPATDVFAKLYAKSK
jgi:putative addiction module component (TIGR02574 family)